jgi:hypothetical protein
VAVRWWWLATLGVIACGPRPRNEPLPVVPQRVAPAEPVSPPGAVPTRWHTTSALDMADAEWRDLDVTGENWRQRVEAIDPTHRAQMASSLLEAGNFDCPVTYAPLESCARTPMLRELRPDSGIDDACLRRVLALWAIDQLPDDALYELFEEMSSLVRIPPPEHELAAAVLARFDSGFEAAQLRWEAKSAGHTVTLDDRLLATFEHDELVRAAVDLHFDAAVLALEPVDDLDAHLYAVDDDELRRSTRLEIMDRLVDAFVLVGRHEADRIHGALWWKTRSDDCIEAAAATASLAALGGTDVELPTGPFESVEAVIAAACARLALDVRGRPWKPLLSKRGIAVTKTREDPFRIDALWTKYPFAYDDDLDGVPDVPEADPDGDGDVATTREQSERRWHKRFTLPYAEELKLALPHCDGNVCKLPGSTVWFELDIARELGTLLRLRGIDRHERVGSEC